MNNVFSRLFVAPRSPRLWMVVWAMMALTVPAAQTGSFTYEEDGTGIIITRYVGDGGAVTIPETIAGKPVRTIGHEAFYGTRVTSVTIPTSVTRIVGRAFAYCRQLTNVTIPNNVTEIQYGAFDHCELLATVNLGNHVTSIGNGAFESCWALASLTIPNSVTTIGRRAFGACVNLTNLSIGNGVTSIGDEAFSECFDLTNVTIPDSVTSIGIAPFSDCSSLTHIAVDASNPSYSSLDGVLFNKDQSALIQMPGGRTGDYIVPDSVFSIGDWAFAYCGGLTSVTIGNGVTSIGGYAFAHCERLASVTIGHGVTSIGGRAFEDCGRLASVTIGHGLTSIGDWAFWLCPGMTNITVSDSNLNYSSLAGVLFNKEQSALIQYPGGKTGSYTVPNGVTSIGDFAFASSRLPGVNIPNSVTSIGNYAFFNSHDLTSVTIPDSVTSIGHQAFAYSSLAFVNFQGNAPTTPISNTFYPSSLVVGYLPGTLGWEATFAGSPTLLVLPYPLIRTSNPGTFTVAWATNATIVIEASSEVSNAAAWTPLDTRPHTIGFSGFSDPDWEAYPARFYRVRQAMP